MLFKRKKSDNWYFKFTVKGKTVYRSTGTSDKAKAQEIADKIKAETYDVIKLGVRQRYLWQDAVIRWMNESEKKSIETDKYHFKWLRAFLDDIYLLMLRILKRIQLLHSLLQSLYIHLISQCKMCHLMLQV